MEQLKRKLQNKQCQLDEAYCEISHLKHQACQINFGHKFTKPILLNKEQNNVKTNKILIKFFQFSDQSRFCTILGAVFSTLMWSASLEPKTITHWITRVIIKILSKNKKRKIQVRY